MSCLICQYTSNYNILRTSCGHSFCHRCFIKCIKANYSYPVECFSCTRKLADNEYKYLLRGQIYRNWQLSKQLWIEATDKNIHKCLNMLCDERMYNYNNDQKLERFQCQSCQLVSCFICMATHAEGQTCSQWKLNNSIVLEKRKQIQQEIQGKIDSRNGMYCVSCGVFIERNKGCFGLKCCICKIELCLITQKARWGPQGFGDLSGGCGCRPGRRCHTSCNSCNVDRVMFGNQRL